MNLSHKPTLVPFCLGIRQRSPTFPAMPAPSIEYYNAAVDAIQAGRLDEALSAAEPDLMLAVYEQGMLLVEVDRLEEALENFSRYLKTHPGDPGARQAIEGIHYRMHPETR